jgi:carboxypeptidase C (cathepsin A)
MGNSAWINQGLALNKSTDWTKWRGSDGQVAGFFEEYATAGKPLTFLTVKGAGHMVPKDRPRHALDMLSRFLAGGGYDKVPRMKAPSLCPAPAA